MLTVLEMAKNGLYIQMSVNVRYMDRRTYHMHINIKNKKIRILPSN